MRHIIHLISLPSRLESTFPNEADLNGFCPHISFEVDHL